MIILSQNESSNLNNKSLLKKGLFFWDGEANLKIIKSEIIKNISSAIKTVYNDETEIIKDIKIKKFTKFVNEKNLLVMRLFLNEKFINEVENSWLSQSLCSFLKTKSDLLKNNLISYCSNTNERSEFPVKKIIKFPTRFNYSQAIYHASIDILNKDDINYLIRQNLNSHH